MTYSIKTLLATATSCALLSACGGGNASSTVITTPVDTRPTYTPGEYSPASDFKNRCENPRAGEADRTGSTLLEKFWLRSWTNETYLWYNEVPDLAPNLIADRVDYFDELKTLRTTASGALVDQFHFSENTEDFRASQSGEAISGYGFSLAVLQGAPPRDVRIAYTQPGSPAAADDGFLRGDKIIEVDGIDVVDGATSEAELNLLLGSLFPAAPGEAHTFTVEGVDGTVRNIEISSADVVEQPVTATSVIDVDDDTKVGYIHFTTFASYSAERAIFDAMTEMETAGVDDLVLDLRYNGGGFLAVAAQLGFMVAGEDATDGKVFDRLTFNDKNPNTDPVTGETLRPTPFYPVGIGFEVDEVALLPEGTPLPELDLDRIFILTTGGTCSASEAVINGLRGIDVEVILVGSQTCGKPYGFYPTDNCGMTYLTVQFRGANDKGFGDYADGFLPDDAASGFGAEVPGCTIVDDFQGALGDENEPFLAAALQFVSDGTCPTTVVAKPTQSKPQVAIHPESDILEHPGYKMDQFIRTSRILGVTDGNIKGLK